MRIVHVVFSFCTGGLETMLVDIMREQVSTDEVHLIVINNLYDRDLLDTVDPRVRVRLLGRRPGSRNPWPLLRLNLLLAGLRPDVVHIHQGSLARLTKVVRRPVLTVHALGIPLDSSALRCRMISISVAVADDLLSRYGSGIDVAVVPNGIDVSRISLRESRPLGSPVRLVQVARFDIENKGQDILIRALELLVERGYDAELTLIGGADFDRIPELEEQSVKAGVDSRVHFVRGMTRDSLYRRLKDFDIMVHPARYEGFGLVVAEGMAAGLPLVVPDSGGPFEVAAQGRLAEVFPIGDAGRCADAIARVIDGYPGALSRAEEGKERVGHLYSLKPMVAQYREIYLMNLQK